MISIVAKYSPYCKLRAGAIIMDVTVTVRTAAAISEIRGYPSSLYRLYFARSAEKSEVTPSSLYEMALCAKRRNTRVNEIASGIHQRMALNGAPRRQ